MGAVSPMQLTGLFFAPLKLGIPHVGGLKRVRLLSCGTMPAIGTQSVLIRDGDGIPFPFVGMPEIDDSS